MRLDASFLNQPKDGYKPVKIVSKKDKVNKMRLNDFIKVLKSDEVINVYMIKAVEKSFNVQSRYDDNLLCVQEYVKYDYSVMNSTKKTLLNLSIYEVIANNEIVHITTIPIDYERQAIAIVIKQGGK